MKKTLLAVAALMAINAGTGFAAPINDLSKGQTAVGVVFHNNSPDSDTFYLEHKLSDNFTLGLQNVDWKYGGSMDDIYGQVNLSNNLRAIVGNRDFDSGSKLYLGAAVNGSLSPDWDGYASLISGSQFNEVQVGANYKIARNVDFNLNYRSYMPDEGDNINGLGFGASLKF